MRDAVNIQAVQFVADGLKDLRDQVVFVGGAVISLYADDPGADTPRPTSDIDLVIEVAGYAAYALLEERLAQLGFHHTPEEPVNCRYRFHGVTVDIMPTDVPALMPTNRWYLPGMRHAVGMALPDGTKLAALTVPYFLGTKFEAHNSRGRDMRTSKDFEDIVFILDARLHLEEEVASAPVDIRDYLKREAQALLKDPAMREAIEGHLSPQIATERAAVLMERLRRMAGG
ncbi:MAG: nucleotidyl transferase AbiEii/AbiGii toxin family protein [Flavobacteriales bacterium]